MILLFGLGNPDEKYLGTRHNIGFVWADILADQMSAPFKRGNGSFQIAKFRFKGHNVAVIKPTTYMNLSGRAVRRAKDYYKVPLRDCLVCYDDLHLPVGTIRLRKNGSHGGHNGIKNIIQETGSREFNRLRMGIGNNFPKGKQVDYVLSPFKKAEQNEIQAALDKAVDSTFCYLKEGIEQAMNNFN